jgi:tRNA dimethylallyltransferase
MKPKIVIVLGPTAVGKSEVALELAETLNGEIVNADSQQVYRHGYRHG